MRHLHSLTLAKAFCLLFLSLGSSAQQRSAQDYLVLHSGDTLYGTVQYMNASDIAPRFYKKIRLRDARGRQRKIHRKKIKAFQTEGTLFEGFYLSQHTDKVMLVNPRYDISQAKGELYFLRLVQQGKLSYYQLEWIEQDQASLFSMDLFKKTSDTFFIRATQGLLGLKYNVLASYFTDCPTLSSQIEDRQINSLQEIIDFYNGRCP